MSVELFQPHTYRAELIIDSGAAFQGRDLRSIVMTIGEWKP